MPDVAAIRRYYDRIGRWQDTQRFYEDAATHRLLEQGRFQQAQTVVELGCGTGRLAEKLLAGHLPARARYRGFEVSERMAAIAGERLRSFPKRAGVTVIDGQPPLPLPDGGADRFVATYVLDLMSAAEARVWLDEARRLLAPDGLACLVSITPGSHRASRFVSDTWTRVWKRRPMLVGGCRPIRLRERLDLDAWHILERSVVTSWLVSSEVVVVTRLA